MKILNISNNVQALLEHSDLFVEVEPAPQDEESTQVEFEGYPSVSHYFSGATSEIATTSQNRRALTHTIEVFVVSAKLVSRAEQLQKVYDITDKVMDIFDKSRDLSSAELNLPRACDLLRPAPAEPMRVSTNHGDGWMVTINLVCEADISNR